MIILLGIAYFTIASALGIAFAISSHRNGYETHAWLLAVVVLWPFMVVDLLCAIFYKGWREVFK
jgi:hypothetical protein